MKTVTLPETSDTQPSAAPVVMTTAEIIKLPNKRAWALEMARRGLHVFPLSEDSKLPLHGSDGHLDATLDLELIREIWTDPMNGRSLLHNIGISPRNGKIVIIDLDEKEGRDGINAYQAMGGEIAGMVSKTPTGGLHIFCLGDDLRTGAGRIAPGIDTRTQDGYVVGPGSTVGGVPYELVLDEPMRPVPQFVVDKIGTRSDRAARMVTTTRIESDKPQNVARAIGIAQKAEPAVQGCWHDYGFRLGCEMARVGLSPEMTVEILREHWAGRGEGFKSEAQFERDVLGGYYDALSQHGIHSVDAQCEAFKGLVVVPPPADDGPAEAVQPATRIRSLSPTQCGQAKPAPYLIKGILARGQVALVAALPAQGKSCFVPLLAYRLAQGAPVFGRKTRPGLVMYAGLEDENGMMGRIEAHRLKYGDAPAFRLVIGVGNLLTSDADRATISRMVREDRPVLVVLDTVRAGWRGLSENDADAMGGVVAFARELAQGVDGEPGPAVILVHHTTKAGGQTASGSGVLEADMDVSLFLSKDEETNVVSVTFGKNRNGESFGQELCFSFEGVVIGTDEDGDVITRPVAVEVDPKTVRRTKALSPTQRAALAILEDLLKAGGEGVQVTMEEISFGGMSFGGSRQLPRIDWQNACELRGLSTATKPADRANVFRKALRELTQAKVVAQLGDQIILLKQDAG